MEGVALYALLSLIATATSASGFMYNNDGDIGVLLPDDPYIYIGHEVVLTCNLTRPLVENSSRMYFTRKDNKVIPGKYVFRLSTRTIQLRLPIESMYDEGNYVCKLNTTHGTPKVIANQYVKVEYAPKVVEDIDCRVYNWENMTCVWDLGVSYIHMEDIKIDLVWTVEYMEHADCPHPTPTSCTWKMGAFDSTYYDGMMYYMQLTIHNKRTGDMAKSGVIKKDTRRIVEPAAVSNVHYTYNSTCMNFAWSHSRPNNSKVFHIQYNSEWDPHHWKKFEISNGRTNVTICGLTPYTIYVVKIRSSPLIDGFLSKEVDTTLLTKEDVPGAAPSLQSGCFSEQTCDMLKDCRQIILYWQPIPRTAANGMIKYYQITKVTQSTGSKEETYVSHANQGSLVLAQSQDYVVEIRGATKAGLSPHFSTIFIPAQSKMPVFPENFIVEAVNATSDAQKLVRMSWEKPHLDEGEADLSIASYTVYMCKGSPNLHRCSSEPLQWKILDSGANEFYTNVSRTSLEFTIFGISLETKMNSGEKISSGILWNSCLFNKNEKPTLAPKNFALVEYPGDNRVRLDWDLFQCHESHGYIHSYLIFFCTASSRDGNCTGLVKVMTVSGKTTTFTLHHLETEMTYRIWLAAEAEAGQGPVTSPLYTTVQHPIKVGISMEEIGGIAAAVVFVCLLALCSVIIFVKRCVSTVKQKFKPYDIIMPHVPLPPIPMPDPLPPQSPSSDDSDSIYERIDGRRHDSSSPSSPDGSLDIPLINKTGTLTKSQLYGEPQKMYLRSGGEKAGTDSGRGSMISAAGSIFSRLQPAGGTLERRQYGYGVTQGHPPPTPSRPSHHYAYGFQSNKTFMRDPQSPVWKKKKLSSSQDVLRSAEPSPYSCVDIVNLPATGSDLMIALDGGARSVGSTYSDPAYCTNNLSATPLRKKCVTLPSKSAENFLQHSHFNIKRHPVDIKTLQDYSDSNDLGVDMCTPSTSRETDDEICVVPTAPVSNNIKMCDKEVEITDDETCSMDENVQLGEPKRDNHNSLRVSKNYVCQAQFEKSKKCKPGVTSSPKQLNIKPGSRPVSEVVNVPAHFYGSLSLLDTDGDATEL
ncbi:interleukin-6 receptor subunit beta-like isoform X2 [Argopecten irradians]|uniref:interleukin-6 receptor subunit beta-like isoform X2 n=1 Tax=Argopecten irradians TaxID=31199 RepID=UPI003720CE3D